MSDTSVTDEDDHSKNVAITPVVPGERLGTICDFLPGRGTYVSKGFVYSAMLGYKTCTPISSPIEAQDKPSKCLSVIRLNQFSNRQHLENSVNLSADTTTSPCNLSSDWTVEGLPTVGDYVWGRVARVTRRGVDVVILLSEPTLGDRLYLTPYRGAIKLVDCVSRKAFSCDTSCSSSTTGFLRAGKQFSHHCTYGCARVHDIREYSIDTIKPAECFRPGDIIRAAVVRS